MEKPLRILEAKIIKTSKDTHGITVPSALVESGLLSHGDRVDVYLYPAGTKSPAPLEDMES